jgi:hypothetical protein
MADESDTGLSVQDTCSHLLDDINQAVINCIPVPHVANCDSRLDRIAAEK